MSLDLHISIVSISGFCFLFDVLEAFWEIYWFCCKVSSLLTL